MAKKEQSKLSKKIDHLCKVIFLTEEGKPKSARLLYSFCLSLLFTVIYFFTFFLLIDVIENMFINSSTQVRYFMEVLIPAIIGSVPCVLLSFAFKNENISLVTAAYRWMAILIVIILFLGIFYFDPDDYISFFSILGIPGILSILCGGFISKKIYLKRI